MDFIVKNSMLLVFTDTVLKSYIVEKARESVASVQDDDTMSLRDRMSVTVRRFDVLEDKDEPGVR